MARDRGATAGRAVVMAGLSLWLCATAGADGSNAGPDPNPNPAAPATLQQLIGTAACRTDADCRTIAVGNKACGGPQAYLAWSTLQADPEAVAAAARRHTAERRALQKPPGRAVSNCALVTDPGVRCVAGGGASAAEPSGRCVLRPAGAGGAGGRTVE